MDRTLAIGQGVYYLATGIWPLVHIRSFEYVTGPKKERWLVKTVGALVTVIGGVVLWAGIRRRVTPEIRALAAGSAAALTAVDVYYAAKRRISPIYFADALPELALIAGWGMSARRQQKPGRRAGPNAEKVFLPLREPGVRPNDAAAPIGEEATAER